MGDILKDLGTAGDIGAVVGQILTGLGAENVGGFVSDLAGGLQNIGDNVATPSTVVVPPAVIANNSTPGPGGMGFGTAGGLQGGGQFPGTPFTPGTLAGLGLPVGGVGTSLPGVTTPLGLAPGGVGGQLTPNMTPAVQEKPPRKRRMNPTNMRAANRAIRRLTGAKKAADSIYCALDTLAPKKTTSRRAPARKVACKPKCGC